MYGLDFEEPQVFNIIELTPAVNQPPEQAAVTRNIVPRSHISFTIGITASPIESSIKTIPIENNFHFPA